MSLLSYAQQDIAVGTWRTHFSYSDARMLAKSPEKVFCASENGFFSYDIQLQETRILSKIDGLSDVGISSIIYANDGEVLVIGYRSGIIDLIYENGLTSIRDIATANLEGDKQINDIVVDEESAFVASSFGVIVINLESQSINENYVQIGVGGSAAEVLELLVRNDSLFALTPEGIQSGNLNQNLLDFNNWTRYDGTFSFHDMVKVESGIYAVSGKDLFRFGNGTWAHTNISLPGEAERIFSVNGELLTTSEGEVFQMEGGEFTSIFTSEASAINDIVSDGIDFFLADSSLGLINADGTSFSPKGPLSDQYSKIKVVNNDVYGFHAPDPSTYNGSQKMDGYSFFSNGTWSAESINGFQNVSDVDLFEGSRYFTSIGDGLFRELTNEVISNIPSSAPGFDTLLTSIAASDGLWFAGHGDQPVHLLGQDGSWQSFSSAQVFNDRFEAINLSALGIAWIKSASGTITVLDAVENQVDLINTADGLPSLVRDIEISIEDNAWVATSAGPVFFPDASLIFSGQPPILPTFENNILFEDEQISAVLTDGGNRVWFGTNRGLWVFDENTSEQVALFNESNSPIPSNNVLLLAYNGRNGEVFIVTDKGLVSYRSASSFGTRVHQNVSVFPNPVRPGYQGQVGISGLASNVSVKITDLNGNLVKEVIASGGTASWDLMDLQGSGVVTGVYYLFSSNADGEETFVGKIAVIR